MYIYLITNLVNDKKYVGQTIQIPQKRWNEHRWLASNNKTQQYIHKALRKYGVDNFKFEVIDECSSHDELNEAEIEWITRYDTFLGEGYNMTLGGMSLLGYSHTQETKDKISVANKGNTYCLGKKLLEDTKEKIRQKALGRTHSEETKQNMSEQRKGERGSFYGKSHTDESNEKNRQSHLGKKASNETKKKMSDMRKGKNNSNYGKRGGQASGAKKVIKIDIDTKEIIECFFSLIDAASSVNTNPTYLSKFCRNKELTFKGFYWRYM